MSPLWAPDICFASLDAPPPPSSPRIVNVLDQRSADNIHTHKSPRGSFVSAVCECWRWISPFSPGCVWIHLVVKDRSSGSSSSSNGGELWQRRKKMSMDWKSHRRETQASRMKSVFCRAWRAPGPRVGQEEAERLYYWRMDLKCRPNESVSFLAIGKHRRTTTSSVFCSFLLLLNTEKKKALRAADKLK